MSPSKAKQAKRVAIYARQSLTKKDGHSVSIAQQIEDGKNKANQKEWIIAGVYTDEDTSGAIPPIQLIKDNAKGRKKHRIALSKLIDDIENNLIDAVICRKLDRLSRSSLDISIGILQIFAKHNVTLLCTDEALPDDQNSAIGEMTISTLLQIARFESRKIKENLLTAKAYLKRHNKKHMGCFTFGYEDKLNADGSKGVAIDTLKAPIVKEIFTKYINGSSLNSIKNWLNKEHGDKLQKNGKQWEGVTIRYMLENPQYMGMQWRKEKINDKTENVELIENPLYPPIISKDTFYEAKEIKLARVGTKHHCNEIRHLLSGILICAGCKNPLTPKKRQGGGFCYRCITLSCKNRAFQMHLDKWDDFANAILSKGFVKEVKKDTSTDIQVSTIKASMDRVKQLVTKGIMDADTFAKMYEESQANIRRLQAQAVPQAPTAIQWGTATVDQRRMHLRRVLASVLVYPHSVAVQYAVDATTGLPKQPGFATRMVWPLLSIPGKNNKLTSSLLHPTDLLNFENEDVDFPDSDFIAQWVKLI